MVPPSNVMLRRGAAFGGPLIIGTSGLMDRRRQERLVHLGFAEDKPVKGHLMALIAAALYNTDFKSVDKEYMYKQFRKKYPHMVPPSNVMQVEERRGLWTIFDHRN